MKNQYEKRIRFVSTLTGLGALLIALYIVLFILNWLIPITITNPESWGEYYKENYSVAPTTTHRALLLMTWIAYMILVCVIVSVAIRVTIQYRRGNYFSKKTYALISQLGIGLMVVQFAYYAALNIDSLIFADSVEGLEFYEIAYFQPDSTDLTIFMCGVFFCVIGWVMKIATEMKEENEAIV